MASRGDVFAAKWPNFLAFIEKVRARVPDVPAVPTFLSDPKNNYAAAYNFACRVYEAMGDEFNAQIQDPEWKPQREALVHLFTQSTAGQVALHRRAGLILDNRALPDEDFDRLKRYMVLFSLLCVGDMIDTDDEESSEG